MVAIPGTPPVIGVIGGSGVYEIDGLTNTHWDRVETSFGEASDELLFGELDGQKLVFGELELLLIKADYILFL